MNSAEKGKKKKGLIGSISVNLRNLSYLNFQTYIANIVIYYRVKFNIITILLNLKCHLSVIRNTVSADYGSQTAIQMITIGSKNKDSGSQKSIATF